MLEFATCQKSKEKRWILKGEKLNVVHGIIYIEVKVTPTTYNSRQKRGIMENIHIRIPIHIQSIIGEINLNIWFAMHTIYYSSESYVKSTAYNNINKLLSEYASLNPYA